MCSVLYLSSTWVKMNPNGVVFNPNSIVYPERNITVSKKILSSLTVLNIDNNKKALNQHITMISVRSYVTED